MAAEKKWLVFYTASRQEKKSADILIADGYEVFLPTQIQVRQWSDRKKKVEVPLFNGYIFVKDIEKKIVEILQTPGIVRNIRHNNKPAVLHEEEYQTILRFLNSGYFVEADHQEIFDKGEKVKITEGQLKGLEGIITGTGSKKKFRVLIHALGVNLTVTIDSLALSKH
ncbi:MAG: UpxY family transcription antiterminator [Cyclobacteriaceae bacterium]|nr:UpxY family transcription antiterminator [Cytophagales bacterium]MCZ8327584.1 UpxY family transcription antiterminator [Cyclobacteriaceae bacterium]